MKLQYLGDSKDSFKWDYHDYLTTELNYPALVVGLMMTPDDNTNHGRSDPSQYPARKEIISFCKELRNSRSVDFIRQMPLRTGAPYVVSLHNGGRVFDGNSRLSYFTKFDNTYNQVVLLDPDNGFEPKGKATDKHVKYSEIKKILNQVTDDSVVSVFQTFRRKSFPDDFAGIKELIEVGYATAIYWHSLMFVTISKSEETIDKVISVNKIYASMNPVSIIK